MSSESLQNYFKGLHIEANVPKGSYQVKLSPPAAVEDSKCWDVLKCYFGIQLVANESKTFSDYKIKQVEDYYYVADLNPARLNRIRRWALFYRICLITCFMLIGFVHFLLMPLARLGNFF